MGWRTGCVTDWKERKWILMLILLVCFERYLVRMFNKFVCISGYHTALKRFCMQKGCIWMSYWENRESPGVALFLLHGHSKGEAGLLDPGPAHGDF